MDRACSVCGGPVRRDNRIGICTRNSECLREYHLVRGRKDPANARARTAKYRAGIPYDGIRRHNMTPDDYERLLAEQGGACAICGVIPETERLSIDHDHACCNGPLSCGECVRGLLCRTCNRVLGLVKDNPDRLLAMAAYTIRTSVKEKRTV